MKRTFLLLSVVALIQICEARILNVPAQYGTIQSAINASVNGDTVLVAPGTYPENIIFRGKRIVLTSRFYLNSDPSFIVNTVIDGSAPSHPDSGSCVRIANGEDSTTVLQGFTLTRGYGTLWFDENGSARYWEGGGLLIALCSPTVKHNIIRNNNVNRTGGASTGGGGIRLGDGKPYILNNIIINNAGLYGGGIVSNYASPTIRNNIIAYNVVSPAIAGPTYGGGGIWVNGSHPGATVPNRIENNTIVGNYATGSGGSGAGGKGGGMLSAFSATINSRNNIVWGNTQTTGGQINVASGSTAIASYSDVEGGYTGTGNINAAPMFADTSFYLLAGSPCVDAGDTSAAFKDPPNPSNPSAAQWPSLGTLRNDMGAYGGPWRKVLGSILTSVEQRADETLPASFTLTQNYPNPFNPETKIQFGIPASGFVSLQVFDILGREVRTLLHEFKDAGKYEVTFSAKGGSASGGNAAGLTSGVYFYRLTANNFIQTKRMVLLR